MAKQKHKVKLKLVQTRLPPKLARLLKKFQEEDSVLSEAAFVRQILAGYLEDRDGAE